MVFRLGAGANALAGGTLAIGESTTISFEVQVNPGTPANTLIVNQSTTDYTGVTTGFPLSSTSNLAEVTILALTTAPVPTMVVLGSGVRLNDTATLEGGFEPTGMITFTLTGPGGVVVYTNVVTVSGNGTYDTSTGTNPGGFLPTVAGTYEWVASYSGDGNNPAVTSIFGDEGQTVDPANPTIVTTPNLTTVTLGDTEVILTDAAVLSGGVNSTGNITFELFHNGGNTPVFTDVVPVNNGNATYMTSFTLPASGMVIGAYQWDAFYSGDSNNNEARDMNSANEQVTISAANPTISTTPNPTVGPLGTTLHDSADLTGGYNPTGAITFTLTAPNGTVAVTEMVSVNGNGTYSTPTGFVANVTGTWHWAATYNGDPNNNSVSSGPLDEPVSIPPSPPPSEGLGESLMGQLLEFAALNPGQTLNLPQLMTQSNQLYGLGNMIIFLDNYIDNINPSLRFLDRFFATYYSLTEAWLVTYNNLVDSLGLEYPGQASPTSPSFSCYALLLMETGMLLRNPNI